MLPGSRTRDNAYRDGAFRPVLLPRRRIVLELYPRELEELAELARLADAAEREHGIRPIRLFQAR